MEDEEKIIEKRSSFRGWKERNKSKLPHKLNIIGITVIVLVFSALVIYPYWGEATNSSAKDKNKISSPIKKVNTISKNSSLKINNTTKINKQNLSLKANTKTNTKTNVSKLNLPLKTNTKNNTTRNISIGKIYVPLLMNGLEINVTDVSTSIINSNVWINVKNRENTEKLFKIGSGTVIIDNMGQQYENIHITRSTEITQTNLSAKAIREGAIFFEKLKEDREPKKLILKINEETAEFTLKALNR